MYIKIVFQTDVSFEMFTLTKGDKINCGMGCDSFMRYWNRYPHARIPFMTICTLSAAKYESISIQTRSFSLMYTVAGDSFSATKSAAERPCLSIQSALLSLPDWINVMLKRNFFK